MYKTFLLVLLIFIGTECSPSSNTKEVSTHDSSVHSADSTVRNDVTSPAPRIEEDTSQLTTRYDELREAVLLEADAYYQVSISTKQYEAVSDVTWYFNSSYSPRYFYEAWSAEGNDGSTEYIIEGGSVVCIKVEERTTVEKWCHFTGGTRTTWDEESGDESVELLPLTYGNNNEDELDRYITILKTLLRDGELIEEDEGLVKIRLENKVDVGVEYTESVEVSIPKELYENIK